MTFYINIYPPHKPPFNYGSDKPRVQVWSTEEEAIRYKLEDCIATIPITL